MYNPSAWCAAQVTSGQELRFRDEILEAQEGELGAYVPLRRCTVWARRGRRWRTRVLPLITGYVFVYMPSRLSDWHIARLSAIPRPRLMRRGDGSPAPVAEADVARLRAEELAGELDTNERDVSLKFWRGRVVIIRCGLMAGVEATVARTPRMGAQKADFLIAGRKYTIPLSLFAEG